MQAPFKVGYLGYEVIAWLVLLLFIILNLQGYLKSTEYVY